MTNLSEILLKYQQDFFKNPKKRKIWVSSRQIGKSFTLASILCYKALQKKNGLSLCVSVNSRSASEIIQKCKLWAEAINVASNGQIPYSASFDSIKWDNGSRVMSLPSTCDSLRGWSAQCVSYDTNVTIKTPSGLILQTNLGIINNVMNTDKTHYILYKITNKINGKIYVGKHTAKHFNDTYFGSGTKLREDIEKYGIENFEMTILFECQNQYELDLLENTVVNQEFCDREDTYNLHTGGKNPVLNGVDNPMYGVESPMKGKERLDLKGKPLSYDHRNNISEGLRERYTNDPDIKRLLSEKIRERYANEIIKATPSGKHLSNAYFDTIEKNIVRMYDFNEENSQFIKISNLRADNSYEIKEETRQKHIRNRIGCHWWNNGTEHKFCKECPGEGWVKGRMNINKNRKYSEKTLLKMSLSQQGKHLSEDTKNLLSDRIKGMVFWNNGNINVRARECPGEGFVRGKL